MVDFEEHSKRAKEMLQELSGKYDGLHILLIVGDPDAQAMAIATNVASLRQISLAAGAIEIAVHRIAKDGLCP